MGAFVRAATLKHYMEVAQTLGLNPDEMLRGVGLTPNMLSDPESCLLYTSPSPRDRTRSRMPSSA